MKTLLALLLLGPSLVIADGCDALRALAAAQEQCDYSRILAPEVYLEGDLYQGVELARYWGEDCEDKAEIAKIRCHANIGIGDFYKLGRLGYIIATEHDGKVSGVWTGTLGRIGYEYGAELGQAADVASTAVGLSAGLVEANPVGVAAGPVPFAVAKLIAPSLADQADYASCVNLQRGLTDVGWAAAAANLAALAGGPIVAGLAVAVTAWVISDDAAASGAEIRCLPAGLKGSAP